jgi:hypothetical protein
MASSSPTCGLPWDNAQRIIEYEYDGEDRLLIIGPARDGTPLEIVAGPADDPVAIIPVNRLQPNHYDYLR